MRSRWLGGLPIVLGAACGDYGAPAGAPVPAEPAPSTASVQDGLTSAFSAPDDTVPVIVNFREPPAAPASGAMPAAIEARRVAIRTLGDQVLADERAGFTVSRRYAHVPAVAGRITRDALERLSHNPNVSYIQRDGRGHGSLKVAVPAIGGDKVKSMYGLTGKGITAAVLDTGVDTTHPDLKDSIVA